MNDENSKKVLIIYSRAQDFKIVPATGVWGGLSPQGEVICNFFLEQPMQPDKMEVTIDNRGKAIKEEVINKNTEPLFSRELQVGVVMRPDIAARVGEWLIEQSKRSLPPKDSEKH